VRGATLLLSDDGLIWDSEMDWVYFELGHVEKNPVGAN
jgi:hypothetical protein